ncbi:MAG: HEPN domain-containing protein [Leptolyngbya sp. LCM1.Bin17]|nr:MAG: HEPN domain-containing protein [Leptolyngbya sp. LCM1.Bin17]
MSQESQVEKMTTSLLHKASQALESAWSEFQAERLDFAANRAYYACFYAASAVMLHRGRQFVKHSGLRGAIH